MNRLACGALFLLAGAVAGCEAVAGIHDKFLSDDPTDASGLSMDAKGDPADAMTNNDSSKDVSTGPRDAAGDEGSSAVVPDVGVDAAPDAPAEAAVEAGSDAPPEDSATDGDFLAPDAGTVDPSAPCSGQGAYLFCDDFDSETMVSQNWAYEMATDPGGSLSFFGSAYTSAPRSLQIVAPASANTPQLVLGRDLATSLTKQLRLGFDLRIEQDSLAGVPRTAIAQIISMRQGTTLEFNYIVQDGQSQILTFGIADGGVSTTLLLPAVPLQKWTRISIAYDSSTGLAVYEDGQQIGSDPSALGGAPRTTQFLMGMVFQNPPGNNTIQYELDNVVFRGN